jgi:hypothetical protein
MIAARSSHTAAHGEQPAGPDSGSRLATGHAVV